MLNIPEYIQYGGETRIALIDTSTLGFMHEIERRNNQQENRADRIFRDYDLILIPKWVMEEIEDSQYRVNYVHQLYMMGYPLRWIDEVRYGSFTEDEDINLYYIVEAAVSRISALMRYLRNNVKTEDMLDLPASDEWIEKFYDEWPISGRTLANGRVLKKNAGEISLTILAEIFSWYYPDIQSITIYTQDTDAHEFQIHAEEKLRKNEDFGVHMGVPLSVAFKSNDFILCQLFREHILSLDTIELLRKDARKLTYTKQQPDKSVILCKEVVTNIQFIELIQDETVQIIF